MGNALHANGTSLIHQSMLSTIGADATVILQELLFLEQNYVGWLEMDHTNHHNKNVLGFALETKQHHLTEQWLLMFGLINVL